MILAYHARQTDAPDIPTWPDDDPPLLHRALQDCGETAVLQFLRAVERNIGAAGEG